MGAQCLEGWTEAANGKTTLVHAVDGSWEATHVLLLLLSALVVFGGH
jgi:hypothetical protein